jgi:hypothetical protein
LDYNASTVLTSNKFFAQAVFYCEQSFEKANKSVIVYYQTVHEDKNENQVEMNIKKDFGHLNKKATAGIVRILIDKEKENYIHSGGSENDDYITKAYRLLSIFRTKNSIKKN